MVKSSMNGRDRTTMGAILVAFLVVWGIGCSLARVSRSPSQPGELQVVQRPSRIPTVLQVRRLDAITGEVIGTGSGVPISTQAVREVDRTVSYTWVLTARHNLPAQQAGGFPIADVVTHPTLDLALLKVALGPVRLLKVARVAPIPGDHLRAIGWFLGDVLAMTDGRSRPEEGGMTCPILWGASGGAVINDQGELVGVIRELMVYRAPWGTKLPAPWLSRYTAVTSVAVREWIKEETK